jgi:hypothetical protein
MPHTAVKLCLFPLLLTAMATHAAEAPLASSYVEAQELGRRDEADPRFTEYHRNQLLPAFTARYRTHLHECQTTLPQPDRTPFSFVAAIGDDGRVLRLWSDRSAPVYPCLRGRLLFERLPAPPRAPFYLYIHMRFASQGAAAAEPPR